MRERRKEKKKEEKGRERKDRRETYLNSLPLLSPPSSS